jgi:predicted RNase H-like HicB family nuclease
LRLKNASNAAFASSDLSRRLKSSDSSSIRLDAEEGGFWAEVPAIPGCATQGETMDELLCNLHEAIEGWLSVDVAEPKGRGLAAHS